MISLKRIILFSLAALLPALAAAETLRVVSWGGSYVRSQILGFIRDFEEATGIDVEVLEYSGGIEEVRSQVRSHNVRWDVVDFELFDALRACEEGLLERIDPDRLMPAPDGTPAVDDFIQGSLIDCGVGNILFSMVIAYNRERVSGMPRQLEDFFNVSDYPGPRGMRPTPKGNLEWALIADGVHPSEVYSVLETEEGLDRAFAVLNRLKPHIRWWTTGEEAMALLERGEVVMSTTYNGRVVDAVDRGVPLEIIWDRQIKYLDVWGVPKHGKRTELAMEFIRFATSTESMARQTQYITYGPVRASSMEQVAPEIRPTLPTAEENLRTALDGDSMWWAENIDRIRPRFERWMQRPFRVPRFLPR